MDVWPPRNWTPERGRRESSVERSMANVRKAHQKALAIAAALEKEIEWLSCPPARSQQVVRTHSRSRDCQIHESRGQKRRCCQMQLESCPAPYFEYNPSQRNSESGGEVMATEYPDLEEPLELGPEVTSFLQRVSWELGRRRKGTLSQTTSERALQMGGMESQNVWNTWLVERVFSSTRGESLQRAGTESVGLTLSSQKGKWGK